MRETRAGRSQSVLHTLALVRLVVATVPWDARFKEVNMIQYSSFISLMKVITGVCVCVTECFLLQPAWSYIKPT